MTAAQPARPDALIRCSDLHKSFGRVSALAGASLTVRPAEIVAVVGENGAGKSTLVRIVAGELEQDAGTVEVAGSVGVVRQQLSTVAELSVLENLVFAGTAGLPGRSGRGRRLGRIDWRAERRRLAELAERTGLLVPLDARAGDLAPGIQQRAELLGALFRGAGCLLLDEPTSYLTPQEVDRLFEAVRGLAAAGLGVVFISHKLREVAAHCDRVVVLRQGRSVAGFDRRPFQLAAIGQAMTGTGSAEPPPAPRRQAVQPPASELSRLSCAAGRLNVAAGSIVGIAGVAGNGQDELIGTLAGIGSDSRYEPVLLGGRDVTGDSCWQRRAAGLRLIPGNVRAAGATADASLTDNLLTAMVPARFTGRFGSYSRHSAIEHCTAVIRRAGIVARGPDQAAGELSGGNLQRLVIARELDGEPAVLVAHEPTRGVDFAAAGAIHRQLLDFAARGGAVLLLTSDLDELLLLSDRVHILFEGELSAAYRRSALSLARLGELLGGLAGEPAEVLR